MATNSTEFYEIKTPVSRRDSYHLLYMDALLEGEMEITITTRYYGSLVAPFSGTGIPYLTVVNK